MSEYRYLPRRSMLFLFVTNTIWFVGSASAEALIDPTRPAGWNATVATQEQATVTENVLVLQGTFNVAGRRSAVIGGQRVGVGDRVSGAEVIEIRRGLVVLLKNGETLEIASSLPAVKTLTDRELTVSRHVADDAGRLLK